MTFKSKLRNLTNRSNNSRKKNRTKKIRRRQQGGKSFEIAATRYEKQYNSPEDQKIYEKLYNKTSGFVGEDGKKGSRKARNILKKLAYDGIQVVDGTPSKKNSGSQLTTIITQIKSIIGDGDIDPTNNNILRNVMDNLDKDGSVGTSFRTIKGAFTNDGVYDKRLMDTAKVNLKNELKQETSSDLLNLTKDNYNEFVNKYLDNPMENEVFRGTSQFSKDADLEKDIEDTNKVSGDNDVLETYLEGDGSFKDLTEVENKGLLSGKRENVKKTYTFGASQKEKLIGSPDHQSIFQNLLNKYQNSDNFMDLPILKNVNTNDGHESILLKTENDQLAFNDKVELIDTTDIEKLSQNLAQMNVYDKTQGFEKIDQIVINGKKNTYDEIIDGLKELWKEFITNRNAVIRATSEYQKSKTQDNAKNLRDAYTQVIISYNNLVKRKTDLKNAIIVDENGNTKLKKSDTDTPLKAKSGLGVFRVTSKQPIIERRLQWCHQLEQLYLIKHYEIISLSLYISIMLNHLYIIHFIFNQIVQIVSVGEPCPGITSVILPPSYQMIIQKYFKTQNNDINLINSQMEKMLPIFKALKSAVPEDDKFVDSEKNPKGVDPKITGDWRPRKASQNVQSGGAGPGADADVNKVDRFKGSDYIKDKGTRDPETQVIKYGVPRDVVNNLNKSELDYLMKNIKDSTSILQNIKESVTNINASIKTRSNKKVSDYVNSDYKYTQLYKKIAKGDEIKYSDLQLYGKEDTIKVKQADVQTYLNNCHNLEKLYIRKHHEFVYLKNVYMKLLYFYLVIFIVFYYYISNIEPSKIDECGKGGSANYVIPDAFLKNVRNMVIEQSHIINSLQKTGEVTQRGGSGKSRRRKKSKKGNRQVSEPKAATKQSNARLNAVNRQNRNPSVDSNNSKSKSASQKPKKSENLEEDFFFSKKNKPEEADCLKNRDTQRCRFLNSPPKQIELSEIKQKLNDFNLDQNKQFIFDALRGSNQQGGSGIGIISMTGFADMLKEIGANEEIRKPKDPTSEEIEENEQAAQELTNKIGEENRVQNQQLYQELLDQKEFDEKKVKNIQEYIQEKKDSMNFGSLIEPPDQRLPVADYKHNIKKYVGQLKEIYEKFIKPVEEQAKADADAQAKAEADAQARVQAEDKARAEAEAEAKAKAEADAEAKKKAEESNPVKNAIKLLGDFFIKDDEVELSQLISEKNNNVNDVINAYILKYFQKHINIENQSETPIFVQLQSGTFDNIIDENKTTISEFYEKTKNIKDFIFFSREIHKRIKNNSGLDKSLINDFVSNFKLIKKHYKEHYREPNSQPDQSNLDKYLPLYLALRNIDSLDKKIPLELIKNGELDKLNKHLTENIKEDWENDLELYEQYSEGEIKGKLEEKLNELIKAANTKNIPKINQGGGSGYGEAGSNADTGQNTVNGGPNAVNGSSENPDPADEEAAAVIGPDEEAVENPAAEQGAVTENDPDAENEEVIGPNASAGEEAAAKNVKQNNVSENPAEGELAENSEQGDGGQNSAKAESNAEEEEPVPDGEEGEQTVAPEQPAAVGNDEQAGNQRPAVNGPFILLDYLNKLEEKIERSENWENLNNTHETKWHIIVREFKETELGAARVIVYIRDSGKKNNITISEDAECIETLSHCGSLPKELSNPRDAMGYSLTDGEPNKESPDTNDKANIVTPTRSNDFLYMSDNANKKVYGPFSNVYENTSTENLFGGFSDLTEKLLDGKNILIFGFGFSGSGKTYQLVAENNPNAIVKLYLNKLAESGKVKSINFNYKELYPKDTDNILINNPNVKPIKWTKGQGQKIDKFIEDFTAKNKEITRDRILKLRITPTPNNPESSRSHIFYEFDIDIDINEGEKKSKLVIVDMAGTENTIEIRKDFMNGKGLELKEPIEGLKGAKRESTDTGGWYADLSTSSNINTIISNDTTPVQAKIKIFESYYKASNEILKLLKNNSQAKRYIQIEDMGSQSKNIVTSVINFYKKLLDKTYEEDSEKKWLDNNANELPEEDLNPMFDSFKILTRYDEEDSVFNIFKNIINEEHFKTQIKEFFEKDYVLTEINIETETEKKKIKNKNKEKTVFNISKLKLNDNKDNQNKKPVNYKNGINLMLLYIKHLLATITKKDGIKDTFLNAKKKFKFVCLLEFMSNYINLVVEQGKGIVTTLEHIKYFFMHASMPNKRTIFDTKTGYNYNSLGSWRPLGIESNDKNPLTDEIMHTYPQVKSGDFKWTEKRNVGEMEQYKILEELLRYSGSENPQLTLDEDTNRCETNKCGKHVILNPGDGACFVMLALIKRGELKKNDSGNIVYDEDEADKYRNASQETLELANILKSEPSKCDAYIKLIGKNANELENENPCYVDGNSSGGGYQLNKTRKQLLRKKMRTINKRISSRYNKSKRAHISRKTKKLSGGQRRLPQKLRKTLSALGHTSSWNYSGKGGALTVEKKHRRHSSN